MTLFRGSVAAAVVLACAAVRRAGDACGLGRHVAACTRARAAMKVALAAAVLLSCLGCKAHERRDVALEMLDRMAPITKPRESAVSRIVTFRFLSQEDRFNSDEFNSLINEYRKAVDREKKEQAKRLRNAIIWRTIRAIREYHEAVEDDLFEGTGTGQVAFDVLDLIFKGIGLASGTESTKQLMLAISAGLTGTRASLQTHFLGEKSKEFILVEMQTQRLTQLTEIIKRLDKEVADYSLDHAASDLLELLWAGSVKNAVTTLSKESKDRHSEAVKHADEAIRSYLKLEPPTPTTDKQTEKSP